MESSKFQHTLIVRAITSIKLVSLVAIIQSVHQNVKKIETAWVILGMDAAQIGVSAGSKKLSQTVKPSMLVNAGEARA